MKQQKRDDAMKTIINQEGRRERAGASCSFNISVNCTHNATWQGQIRWVETKQEKAFRSVLEMLKLMDEAVTEGAEDAGSANWIGEEPEGPPEQ